MCLTRHRSCETLVRAHLLGAERPINLPIRQPGRAEYVLLAYSEVSRLHSDVLLRNESIILRGKNHTEMNHSRLILEDLVDETIAERLFSPSVIYTINQQQPANPRLCAV